jgi:protein N-terminal methyltransferase
LDTIHPPFCRYDCIWIQWCLLYITDADVQIMFSRARLGLKPDGLIFVKENICKDGFIVDNEDSSLTRSNAYMIELFEKSNMQLIQSSKQRNFPKDLFDVRMYVLKPR